ncbi:MAG: transporter associated domain-containing protein, partial [bacterium]|nr:transporter associated domain-containing protein [bacterium]
GEIWDESDRKINQITRNADGSITVDGKFTIRDLNKTFGVDLPEDEFNTVAGLILQSLGNIPDKNEKVEYMGFEFTAKEVVEQAVKKVLIRKLEASSEEGGD